MSMEGGGASSALQSLLSGGGGDGGGGGGAGSGLDMGNGCGQKMVNEGAAGCSIEGKTLVSNPQGGMFGAPQGYGLLGFVVDKCLQVLGISGKGIVDEIANIAKSDSGEITGDNAAPVQQVGSADEVNGNDKAAIVALDLSAFTKMNIEGVEPSGPIRPNVAAAESSTGASMSA